MFSPKSIGVLKKKVVRILKLSTDLNCSNNMNSLWSNVHTACYLMQKYCHGYMITQSIHMKETLRNDPTAVSEHQQASQPAPSQAATPSVLTDSQLLPLSPA